MPYTLPGLKPLPAHVYTIEICPKGRFCLLSCYKDGIVEKKVILIDLLTGKFVTLAEWFPIIYAGFSKEGTSCFIWSRAVGFFVYNMYKTLDLSLEEIEKITHSTLPVNNAPATSQLSTQAGALTVGQIEPSIRTLAEQIHIHLPYY